MTDAKELAARLREGIERLNRNKLYEGSGEIAWDRDDYDWHTNLLREAAAALESQAAEIANIKPKLTARAKSMLRLRDMLTFVVDELDDEGDRVYFGSSNHAEQLREITECFDSWAWSDIIKDGEDVDYIGECASLRIRIAALEQAAAPFVREAYSWEPGAPADNDVLGDNEIGLSLTWGDLRALARAAGGGE